MSLDIFDNNLYEYLFLPNSFEKIYKIISVPHRDMYLFIELTMVRYYRIIISQCLVYEIETNCSP